MIKEEKVLTTSVRSLYDLQKLRVSAGNRICASFRSKLGLEPSEAESVDADAEKLLGQLRAEYSLMTEGVKKITRNTKPKSELITSVAEMQLIESYEQLVRAEAVHEKIISWELEKEKIWTEWLLGVRGVGPKMAGVIVTEIDIRKCNSISALWKYAGLDVVVYEKDGEMVEEGRCRKKPHLVEKTYTTREGTEEKTVGIAFNPRLKTKMIGVLGASFIKLGGPYREIYDNYKHRLENHPKHMEKTKGHRHAMAVRYMIKEFLADLWTEWRTLEGLEVRPRYNEEKLGIYHSKEKAA